MRAVVFFTKLETGKLLCSASILEDDAAVGDEAAMILALVSPQTEPEPDQYWVWTQSILSKTKEYYES